MTANVEYLHSKSRSQHITCGASSLSWETLTYILYWEPLEACRYRAAIVRHSGLVGLQICYGSDGSLNEPFSKSHMNMCKLNSHIQAIPNETQFNSFQRDLSWQTDICTAYPHLSSVSKQLGIENEHWYNTGLYTHFSV